MKYIHTYMLTLYRCLARHVGPSFSTCLSHWRVMTVEKIVIEVALAGELRYPVPPVPVVYLLS